MKKKVVSLLMVSAMLISVMSGCGSSAASQENGDMETSTEAENQIHLMTAVQYRLLSGAQRKIRHC